MKKILAFGPIFIVAAAILWSLDGLLRVSLYVLPPITIVFFEHLIGFLLLSPFLIKSFTQIKKIDQKTWGAFAWITLLSSILGTLFYTAALGKISFINFSVVVLLQKLQPIFAIGAAHFVLKEKIPNKFFLYLVLALIGGYMVSFPDLRVNLETGRGTIEAALFAVAAAFAWGSSTAFSRYALLKLPTLVTTGLRFGLATLLGLVFVFLLGAQGSLTAISTGQLLTLLIIALSTGMVALTIYYYGLKRTPVRIATFCELAWPLSAVAIDYFYFHRGLSLTQILGALLLLVTIYQVTKLAKPQET
jgi:drug/metabolite transporter (DMT)-like permease